MDKKHTLDFITISIEDWERSDKSPIVRLDIESKINQAIRTYFDTNNSNNGVKEKLLEECEVFGCNEPLYMRGLIAPGTMVALCEGCYEREIVNR